MYVNNNILSLNYKVSVLHRLYLIKILKTIYYRTNIGFQNQLILILVSLLNDCRSNKASVYMASIYFVCTISHHFNVYERACSCLLVCSSHINLLLVVDALTLQE